MNPRLKEQQATSAEALLGEVLAFCRQHGPKCGVSNWPDWCSREYLAFHALNNSLALVRRNGRVVGMAIGWQCREDELEKHWVVTNPLGDCFYFANLVASERNALPELIRIFITRIPAWRGLRLFANRRGKLIPYTVRHLQRLDAQGRK